MYTHTYIRLISNSVKSHAYGKVPYACHITLIHYQGPPPLQKYYKLYIHSDGCYVGLYLSKLRFFFLSIDGIAICIIGEESLWTIGGQFQGHLPTDKSTGCAYFAFLHCCNAWLQHTPYPIVVNVSYRIIISVYSSIWWPIGSLSRPLQFVALCTQMVT